jgi:hypothetical protein
VHSAAFNDDILRMSEIGIEIPVAELYEDVTFSSDDEPPPAVASLA